MAELTLSQELPKTGLLYRLRNALKRITTSKANQKAPSEQSQIQVKYEVPPDRKELARQEQKAREERIRKWKMQEAGKLKAQHLEDEHLKLLRRKLKART